MFNKIFKSKQALIALFLVAVFAAAVIILFWHEKGRPPEKAIVSEPDFFEMIEDFYFKQRRALILSGVKDYADAREAARQAAAVWFEIDKHFRFDKPKLYSQAGRWEERMQTMFDLMNEAGDLSGRFETEAAYLKLAESMRLMQEIRSENHISHINDHIPRLYDLISALSRAKNKEEAGKYLPELKLLFLSLKEVEKNEDIIAGMESQIAIIDKVMDGPDFQNAKQKLLEIFLENYINPDLNY